MMAIMMEKIRRDDACLNLGVPFAFFLALASVSLDFKLYIRASESMVFGRSETPNSASQQIPYRSLIDPLKDPFKEPF